MAGGELIGALAVWAFRIWRVRYGRHSQRHTRRARRARRGRGKHERGSDDPDGAATGE